MPSERTVHDRPGKTRDQVDDMGGPAVPEAIRPYSPVSAPAAMEAPARPPRSMSLSGSPATTAAGRTRCREHREHRGQDHVRPGSAMVDVLGARYEIARPVRPKGPGTRPSVLRPNPVISTASAPAEHGLSSASSVPGDGIRPVRSIAPGTPSAGSAVWAWVVGRKDAPEDLDHGAAPGPGRTGHRPGVGTGPGNGTLRGDRLGELPFDHGDAPTAVPPRSRHTGLMRDTADGPVPTPGSKTTDAPLPAVDDQLSLLVASVHRSSSARSACTLRQISSPPMATSTRMSSFFTV